MIRGSLKTLPVLIVYLLLCGCSPKDSTPHSATGMYFDTLVSIDLYGTSSADADIILDECMGICEKYENLFDKNIITSDIARINSASGNRVTVDHETAVLIESALEYCKASEGRFDITVAPVTALWDFHGDNNVVPDDSDLKRACALVDYKKVTVDTEGDTVMIENGASLELGAAAKGYIADRIAEYLDSRNIPGAIINMGGDIKLIGTKPDGSPFLIGINDPFSEGEAVCALSLNDMAVATSGTYERCFTANGVRYHHIIDTATGYPVNTDIESVTVITEHALDADCLCTLAMIYGSDDAVRIIEQTENTEAIMILSDGSMIKTSGANRYIRQ